MGGAALGPRVSLVWPCDEVKDNVEYFRYHRDGLIFYTGIVHGLQVLDAIVDAYLHGFDVGDESVQMHVRAVAALPGGGFSCRARRSGGLHVKPPR